jgi:O-antigen/teichoic acid export membrane protein
MLVHKYMMKVVSNVVSAVASFLSLMFMTRYVGLEYGSMMWGWAFVAMFNAVVGLGFETAHIRFIASGRNQDKCFSTYLAIRISLTSLMVVLTIVSLAVGIYDGTIDRGLATVVLIFVAYYAIWDIQNALTATFDGRLESGKSSIVNMADAIIRSAILISLALMQVSAAVLSSAYMIGIVASASVALVLARNLKIRLVRPTMFREYLSFAAPLIISSLFLTVLDFVDKVMIGLSGSTLEVGYYTAAMGVAFVFISLGGSLNNVILPQLSKPETVRTPSKMEGLIWMSQKYLMMFLFPVMVVLMVFGEEIGGVLFGAGYSKAGTILSILSVTMTLRVLAGTLTQVLYASNRAALYTKASIVYAAVVASMFVLLIPNTGILPWDGLYGVGAAISLAIGYVVLTVVLLYYVRRATGIRPYKNIWKHLLSLAVTAAALVAVDTAFEITGLLEVASVSLLGLLVYAACLTALRELLRSDISFFMNAINLKQIKDSLDDELR